MGNIITNITEYLGYNQDNLSSENKTHPTQPTLEDQITQTKQQTLEDQIRSLQNQIDQDRDDKVTKEELRKYFNELTDKIDSNNDGVITQNELENYVNQQLELSKSETEQWKEAYQKLNEEYENLLDRMREDQTKELEISLVSPQALKDYIESEVINTDANMRLIPDPLERRVYLTVYKTIMKSLEGLFNTTSVDVLNHRISFAIQPIPISERKIKQEELEKRKVIRKD